MLKERLNVSCREPVRRLASLPGVMRLSGAERLPHHTTLRKFAGRLAQGVLNDVIAALARPLAGTRTIVAVDATGFSQSNASRHFVKRLQQFRTERQVVRDFAKATLAVDVVTSHTADVKRILPVLEKTKAAGLGIWAVLADKGYDSEQVHTDLQELFDRDLVTRIPVRRCEPKLGRQACRNYPYGCGRYRQQRDFDTALYRLRNIIECVNSMLKRKMSDAVHGRSLDTQAKEIKCTVIAHNFRRLVDSGLVRIR